MRPAALALSSAAMWGTSDFCGGLVTRRARPAVIVMIAHGLGLLALLIGVVILHAGFPGKHTIEFGLLAGLAGGIGLILLYKGLSLGSMGLVAAVSGVLTTVVPVVVAFVSEGRPSILQLGGFFVAGAAIWLIAYTPSADRHPHGLGFAVGAGICFGLLLVFLRVAAKDSLLWALTWSRVGSFGCALAVVVGTSLRIRQKPVWPIMAGWRAVFPLAAIAGLLDTGGNLLYTAASIEGRMDIAAVLSSLYPAGTILLAIWLLRERVTRSQAAGMALAMLAVSMISA